RGGGGNFGVVTSFEFKLNPVKTVLGGALFYPIAKAREVLRFYREVTSTAPDALTVFTGMMHSPEGAPVIVLILCYNGPVDEGETAIKAIREFETPVAGGVQEMPYTVLQGMLDAGFPSGLNVHWRSEFIATIPDAFIDAAVDAFGKVQSPMSAIL